MTLSLVVFAALVLAFASLVTTHVAIAFGLATRKPRWRALVALVVVPAAPFLAWREGMRLRAGIWSVAFVIYAGTLAASAI